MVAYMAQFWCTEQTLRKDYARNRRKGKKSLVARLSQFVSRRRSVSANLLKATLVLKTSLDLLHPHISPSRLRTTKVEAITSFVEEQAG